jgi:hypothetical protein
MAGPVSNYSDEIAAAMAEAEKQSQLNPQPDPASGLPYASVPQAWTEGDDMARIGRFLRPSAMVDDRRNNTVVDEILQAMTDDFTKTLRHANPFRER